MISQFLLKYRSRSTSSLLKFPFRQIYNLLGYIDHLTSNGHPLFKSVPSFEEVQRTVSVSSNLNFIYVANCLEILSSHEIIFLEKMSKSQANVFIIVNCSNHQDHQIGTLNSIWTRENRGRDLAAIRDFMFVNFELIHGADLCIINSSCFWSESRLADTVVDIQDDSYAGITFGTESKQNRFHYQTFFIFVPKGLLSHFRKSTEFFRNWRTKRAAVIFGEYLLGERLQSQGIECRAYFSKDLEHLLNDPKDAKRNNSLVHASHLLELGAPFLKKGAASKDIRTKYSRDFFIS